MRRALDRLGFFLFSAFLTAACLVIPGASLIELARHGRLPTFFSTGRHGGHWTAKWWTSSAEPWSLPFTSSLMIYGMLLCLGVVMARITFSLLLGRPLVRDPLSRIMGLLMLALFVVYLLVHVAAFLFH